jgi:phytoene/squalene synthetase
MPNFIDRNYDSPLGLLSSPRALAELARIGAFGRLGAAVRKRFKDRGCIACSAFRHVRRPRPESALALYAVITYMDSIEGVWFPQGGIHAVPTIMAQVAEKAGVAFRYGDAVQAVLRSPAGRVAGVRTTSGARIVADAVVCTVDLPTAYQQLLGDLRPPRAARGGQYSPSAVVWHVGVRGTPAPPVAHHNIHFGEQWNEAFDALLNQGRFMPDPSRFVTIPSLDDATLAPAGCSTLYVLEPVPNLSGKINWSTEAGPLRERLHAFLAQQGYPNDVITEKLVTPDRLAGTGDGGRHPVRTRPYLWPDRTLPPIERGAAAARNVLCRLRNDPRGRSSDRAHLRQARGQASPDIPPRAGPMSDWMSYEAVLTEGYRRSAQLTWRYGTTYFWGAALLPKPQRKHVHAIYALCRLADDIVDLPNGQAPSRQEPDDLLPEPDDILPEHVEMRPEPVEELAAGNSSGTAHLADYDIPAEPDPTLPELEPTDPAQDQEGAGQRTPDGLRQIVPYQPWRQAGSTDPVIAAAVDTAITCRIDPECFDRFFDAMAMDLTRTSYHTWEDLRSYMEGSAAVIGEMMLPVLEPMSQDAKAPARSLGLAFQLTNFLRDVDEDLDRGRVYMPQEDFAAL